MQIDASLMFEPTRIAEMAQLLERAGFDGAYTFEGQHDPFVSLASAAAATERMQLMTAIAVAFARNPMSLAYLANDLQLLSRGRFTLGLGTQVKTHIERRFGMPWSQPVARMREMVAAIRAIWHSWQTGEKLHFSGDFYHHTLMSPTFSPGPNPHGSPRIFVAGVGPAMTAAAVEVGDGLFVHPFHSRRSLDELTIPAVRDGLAAAGKDRRDVVLSSQVILATGLDERACEQAVFSARSQIAFYGSTPAYRPVLALHGWEAAHDEFRDLARDGKWREMAALVDDEMLDAFAVVGGPAEIGPKLLARCQGVVDRVSPVIYQPDTELLTAVLHAVRAALGKQ